VSIDHPHIDRLGSVEIYELLHQATSLSRDSRRGKDLGFSHDFSAASLGESWHLF
jgi:hypothetical protein